MPVELHAGIIPEVDLTFGGNSVCHDPKAGITNYGPCSTDFDKIPVAVIGDAETIGQVKQVLDMIRDGVPGKNKHPAWTPAFPGLRRDSTYRCEVVTKTEWMRTLDPRAIKRIKEMPGLPARIVAATKLFCDEIKRLKGREGEPKVFICAPPKELMDVCLPLDGDRGTGRRGKTSRGDLAFAAARESGQVGFAFFDKDWAQAEADLWEQEASDNFHHTLKVKALELEAATQFIKPYTLDKILAPPAPEPAPGEAPKKKRVQDKATFCWNLATGLYYKAGGAPWKIKIPQGACFIGISFFRHKDEKTKMGTSVAQIFTHDGEGLVVKGGDFRWPFRREPHLTKEAMRSLLKKAIEVFENEWSHTPTRVVVHKSSRFNDDEKAGAHEALADVAAVDLMSIRQAHSYKVFRSGYNPVARGTFVTLPDKRRLLFTKGYVPALQVYPGPRVPRPVEVWFDDVRTPHDQLCEEIMALSRLNWNSADYACHEPMTLAFAKTVGKILREMPPNSPEPRSAKYRYYM